jgi:hypothetical protein
MVSPAEWASPDDLKKVGSYVRHTRKGSRLYIRFKSGRKRRLPVSSECVRFEAFATALNTALYTHHEA